MTTTSTPFVIERTYNAPIAKVWDALTNKDKMKQWYFDIKDFTPTVGFEFSFGCENEGIYYVHLCRVTEVIEGKKFSHTWRYEGYEGDSEVTFELFAEGNKTRLKLTHTGLESFPASNIHFARSNFSAGWTEIIGELLKNYVEEPQSITA